MLMTQYATVKLRQKRKSYWSSWVADLLNVNWNYILIKQRLFIAKMEAEKESITTRHLISWDTPSDREQ